MRTSAVAGLIFANSSPCISAMKLVPSGWVNTRGPRLAGDAAADSVSRMQLKYMRTVLICIVVRFVKTPYTYGIFRA